MPDVLNETWSPKAFTITCAFQSDVLIIFCKCKRKLMLLISIPFQTRTVAWNLKGRAVSGIVDVYPWPLFNNSSKRAKRWKRGFSFEFCIWPSIYMSKAFGWAVWRNFLLMDRPVHFVFFPASPLIGRFFLGKEIKTDPFWISGREITLFHQYCVIGAFSLITFYFVGAGSTFMAVLSLSLFIMILHAAFFGIEDDGQEFAFQLEEV